MAAIPHVTYSSPILRSAARFAVVGVLGTLIDMALFAALHLALGLVALPANLLSYSAGMVNNFLLHRRWTFAAAAAPGTAAHGRAVRQFARFAAVSFSALALNTLVVTLLAPVLGALLPDAQAALAAKACASAVGLGWNFLANHRWAFRT